MNNTFYSDLLNKVDIVEVIGQYLTLTKKGRSYVCLCPFHADSDPSLTISPEKQIFKCFVCLAGGNAITFIEKYKKISRLEALEILAYKYNFDISHLKNINKISLYNDKELEQIDFLNRLNSFFKLELKLKLKNDYQLKEFFEKRFLNQEIIDYFDIGYANFDSFKNIFNSELTNNDDILYETNILNINNNFTFNNRITFAIKDQNHSIIGFSARVIKEGSPKYLNSAESSLFQKSTILYNYANAIENSLDNKLILCEGFFDVIALYKIGFKNVIALMGTALTNEHYHLLKDKKIILFLDGDNAGIKATIKISHFLIKNNISFDVVVNTSQMDPDELLNHKGENYLKNLINNSSNGLDYLYDFFVKENNLIPDESNSLNSIKNFVEQISEYLIFLPQNLIDFYSKKIDKEFNFNLNLKSKNNSKVTNLKSTFNDYVEKNENINSSQKILFNKKNKNKFSTDNKWIDTLFYLVLNHPFLKDIFIYSVENELNGKLINENSINIKEYEFIFEYIKNNNDYNIWPNEVTKYFNDININSFFDDIGIAYEKQAIKNNSTKEELLIATLKELIKINKKILDLDTTKLTDKVNNSFTKVFSDHNSSTLKNVINNAYNKARNVISDANKNEEEKV
ncbi:DNA primase [Mycoplasma sp. 744]|uniref:DNA primase n=1 Tax=Mycoplasma sp. 744 TaxID=3108531 RepID=UPI002B1D9C41|nr:DNA primase [Mycoplasma sp. 744]MEA4115527.1 DNA primase [Mycoplasma sp. 744]